jgi:peptidoglycan glycosyltransferase
MDSEADLSADTVSVQATPVDFQRPPDFRQPDTALGRLLGSLMKQYRPDYGAWMLVDGSNNRILAWAERRDGKVHQDTVTLLNQAKFPVASLIKTITVAAAFESGRYNARSLVPDIGSRHTLYKNQLAGGGKVMGLDLAYGTSANPALGWLGQRLGGPWLQQVAWNLGFNRPLPGQVGQGVFTPADTGYALAEKASGFHDDNLGSPVHMAALFRALFFRRPLSMPWAPEVAGSGLLAKPALPIGGRLSDNTYRNLMPLFEASVQQGTATKNTRKYLRKDLKERLLIGGKTGSLGSGTPTLRYEWYAGFAADRKDPSKSVIFVFMQAHDQIRSLPATAVATLVLNEWAKQKLNTPQAHKNP